MMETEVKQDIAEKIKSYLSLDNRVLSSQINVDVLNGTVKLTGEVPSYSSRVAAEEDALSISGVKHVENNLKVMYSEMINIPSDSEIKSFIKFMIRIDPRIDYENIIVNVENGFITLVGNVNANWKKEQVERYASRVTGVFDVINNISIDQVNGFSDSEIQTEMKNAFRRNILLDADDIIIEVNNGVVNLSGFVPSYTAKMKARQIANNTSGVTNVINHLEVR